MGSANARIMKARNFGKTFRRISRVILPLAKFATKNAKLANVHPPIIPTHAPLASVSESTGRKIKANENSKIILISKFRVYQARPRQTGKMGARNSAAKL